MRSFPPGCLALVLFAFLLVLLPFFLADVMVSALSKLGLSPQQSVFAAIGIFFGSMFNIPVKKFELDTPVKDATRRMYGMGRELIYGQHQPNVMILAVNMGGCVVPVLIALYQIGRLLDAGGDVAMLAGASVLINIVVCERLAKPVENMGIAIPALIPAFVAAICALLLTPEYAPSVAFTSGVLGPLIGADLLHLREIKKISSGMASIGGAGTFDGIVLSGIVATLLA
ncbi:MAG: DUF1614 domain-containing protein [Balneolaceae bacterium]|nr:DUF1614 domain-containing protein [Balneolaceae bacterium]